MIDSRQLAQQLYYGIIEEIARLQGDIIDMEDRQHRFGNHAVAKNKFLRTLGAAIDRPENVES